MDIRRLSFINMSGRKVYFSEYRSILIVNVSPSDEEQFKRLQTLYEKFGARGFIVVGFPCAQFSEKPFGNREISEFCRKLGITFPLSQTVSCKGKCAGLVFKELSGGKTIKADFEKFLISKNGTVRRYPSSAPFEEIKEDIEKYLERE